MSKRIKGKSIKDKLDEISSRPLPAPTNANEDYLKTDGFFSYVYNDTWTEVFVNHGDGYGLGSNSNRRLQSYSTNSDPITNVHKDPLFSGSILSYWDFRGQNITATSSSFANILAEYVIASTDDSNVFITATFQNGIKDANGHDSFYTEYQNSYDTIFKPWSPVINDHSDDTRALICAWADERTTPITSSVFGNGYAGTYGTQFDRYQTRSWISGPKASDYDFVSEFNPDLPFTISMWFKPEVGFREQVLVQRGIQFGLNESWSILAFNGNIVATFANASSPEARIAYGTVDMSRGEFGGRWVHLAVSYSGVADADGVFCRIFSDGKDTTWRNEGPAAWSGKEVNASSILMIGNGYYTANPEPQQRKSISYIGELVFLTRAINEQEAVLLSGRKSGIAMPISMNSKYAGLKNEDRTGISVTKTGSVGLQKEFIDFCSLKRYDRTFDYHGSPSKYNQDEKSIIVQNGESLSSTPFNDVFLPEDETIKKTGEKIASKDYLEKSFNVANRSANNPGRGSSITEVLRDYVEFGGNHYLYSGYVQSYSASLLKEEYGLEFQKGNLLQNQFSADPSNFFSERVFSIEHERLYEPWFKKGSSLFNALGQYMPQRHPRTNNNLSGSAAKAQYTQINNSNELVSVSDFYYPGGVLIPDALISKDQAKMEEDFYEGFFNYQHAAIEGETVPITLKPSFQLSELQKDFVVDAIHVQLPLKANKEWFEDVTRFNSGYIVNGEGPVASFGYTPRESWGGPAFTVAIFRIGEGSEKSYDLICSGTIVPAKDAYYKGVTTHSGTLLPGETERQVTPSGFSNYGTPAAIVGKAPKKQYGFLLGEVIEIWRDSLEELLEEFPEIDPGNVNTRYVNVDITDFTGSVNVKMVAAQSSAFYVRRYPIPQPVPTASFPNNCYTVPQAVSPIGRRHNGGDSGRSFNGGENSFMGQEVFTGGPYETYEDPWRTTPNGSEQFFEDLKAPGIDNLISIKVDNKISPYVLKPNDKICIYISSPKSANRLAQGFENPGLTTGLIQKNYEPEKNYQVTVGEGEVKIKFFGSYMQAESPKDDGRLFQNLTSQATQTAVIGDTEIVDQQDVVLREQFGKEYVNRFITGSVDLTPGTEFDEYYSPKQTFLNSEGGEIRRIVQSIYAQRVRGLVALSSEDKRFYPVAVFDDASVNDTLTLKKRIKKKGYLRGISMRDEGKRFYDTMLPSLQSIYKKYGQQFGRRFLTPEFNTVMIAFIDAEGTKGWLSEFPFEGNVGPSLIGNRNIDPLGKFFAVDDPSSPQSPTLVNRFLGRTFVQKRQEGHLHPINASDTFSIQPFSKEQMIHYVFGYNTTYNSLASVRSENLPSLFGETAKDFLISPFNAGLYLDDQVNLPNDANDFFIRGYKFGVQHVIDIGPQYVFNRKHHGFLRDMLEQGQQGTFYIKNGKKSGAISRPIVIKDTVRQQGVNSDPNLSLKVPFFDDGQNRYN